MLYDVWEQAEPGSDYYVPICKRVELYFAEWSVKHENSPDGYNRFYDETIFDAI